MLKNKLKINGEWISDLIIIDMYEIIVGGFGVLIQKTDSVPFVVLYFVAVHR